MTAVKIHHTKAHGKSIAGFEYDCAWCDKSVVKSTSQYEKAFCSDSCRDNWQSENWSGDNNPNFDNATSEFVCDNCEDTYTRHQSHEGRTRFCTIKCSAEWKSENWVGEQSPAWKEVNAESERFSTSERRKILSRDDYTCQDCSAVYKALHAHHIKPSSDNPELAHDIDNGITLCIDCHAERHNEPIRSFILAQKD